MKYIISIFFVVFLVFVTIGIMQLRNSSVYDAYQGTIGNAVNYVKQWFKVKKHNIEMEYDLSNYTGTWMTDGSIKGGIRKPPISRLLVKTKLEGFLPKKFVKKLESKDWDYIFELIYEPIEEKQGQFTVKRYLTKDEIEQRLVDRYRFPFYHFSKQHWNYFWNTVLGG